MITDIYFKVTEAVHGLANHLSGGDPMAKGLISIAILGAIVAALRREPRRLYNYLYTRLSHHTKLMYVGEDEGERQIQEAISQYVLTKTSRRVYQATREGDELAFSQGMGTYWFWDKGALVRFNRSRETKDKVEVNSVAIRTFGKDVRTYISNIPEVKAVLEAGRGKRHYYYFSSDTWPARWRVVSEILPAPQLVIDPEIKEQIEEAVDFFKNNRDWYTHRGLPYKLVFMLYGPPGTGKTSLTRYIADYLNWSVGSIAGGDSRALTKAIRQTSGKNIMLSIQDVDTHFNIGVRVTDKAPDPAKEWSITVNLTAKEKADAEKAEKEKEKEEERKCSDLGMWLDVLQGDIPLDDQVIVFATNHLDQIDPAFYRPGRVDRCILVGNLKYQEANLFFQRYYATEDSLPVEMINDTFPGSRLYNAFTLFPLDKEQFVNELKKVAQ